jgi:hypothetical protein
MTSNCHPRSRCQASWDLRAPRAAERAGPFGPVRVHTGGMASDWCRSGGQVLAQRWRHVAQTAIYANSLGNPDDAAREQSVLIDVDFLAISELRLHRLGHHRAARKPANKLTTRLAQMISTALRKREFAFGA